MIRKATAARINVFLAIASAAFVFVGYRLFALSYAQHAHYAETAEEQTENAANVLSRGTVYLTDKDGVLSIAATNSKFPLMYVVPSRIPSENAPKITNRLAEITDINASEISTAIATRKDAMRVFKQRLTQEQAEKVKAIGERGVGITNETDRFYPNGLLAADVLGFLGYEGISRRGQYGVESFYDSELSGSSMFVRASGSFSAWQILSNVLARGSSSSESETDRPRDLVLTIDKNVQTVIEGKLDETIKRLSAAGGSIIVQEPETGRIIAMADRSSFDPNTYQKAKPESFLNTNTQAIFEPGSSFKPITMAAGLDLGVVTPETKYNDPGVVEVAGFPISNYDEKAHGINTMAQVLEKSLNTGAMFVENLVGDDKFRDYVINVGFGQKTGVDLPGEVSGDITNLYSGRKINFLTASFGQGIAVTPIQLIAAYSAIANGGKLMRPYIVEKMVEEGGKENITKPEVVAIPFSQKTVFALQSMLVSVVERGFDKARIKGYDVAGKTGTAQIADGKGGYLEDQYTHTFLGFAPGHNARFVALIKIDRPQGVKFAADSLSPVFREIAEFLIHYYNIPPTR